MGKLDICRWYDIGYPIGSAFSDPPALNTRSCPRRGASLGVLKFAMGLLGLLRFGFGGGGLAAPHPARALEIFGCFLPCVFAVGAPSGRDSPSVHDVLCVGAFLCGIPHHSPLLPRRAGSRMQ